MIDKHHLAHYTTAGLLALAIGAGAGRFADDLKRVEKVSRTALLQAPKPGTFRRMPGSWDALPREKIDPLVAGLATLAVKQPVTIFCANSSCSELVVDLDNAFELAGWHVRIERRPVDSEAELGVFVGPPSPHTKAVITVLQAAGLPVSETEIDGLGGGLGIIIGQQAH